MSTDLEKRKLDLAKNAFCILLENNLSSRKEIFTDPKTRQHLKEAWEFRFLTYLVQKNIIEVIKCNAKFFKYRLRSEIQKNSEAGQVLNHLLSNDEVLKTLVLTGRDPLSVLKEDSKEENTDISEPLETSELPELPSQEEPLDILAQRLLDIIEVLGYFREKLEVQEARTGKIEKMLVRLMKEFNLPVE